jgi:hypothetical protein
MQKNPMGESEQLRRQQSVAIYQAEGGRTKMAEGGILSESGLPTSTIRNFPRNYTAWK